jgi:hypothetical protein
MRVGLKLTTCALVLSLGLTATDSWAAPGEPSPSAVKTVRRQTPPLLSAAGLKSPRLDKAGLSKQRLQETTTGTKDPRTGQDLSKNANPGSGLPGGKDLGKEFPSAEKQWNERMKGALGGGLSDLSDGTPFDDKPGSNPADDFLKQHGGNIPDPLAGSGSGRSGFSPASNSTNGSSMLCLSDYVGKDKLGKAGDFCAIIDVDGEGEPMTDADKGIRDLFFGAVFEVSAPIPKEGKGGSSGSGGKGDKGGKGGKGGKVGKGSKGQQYEGEGGYTGGGGHSANDLYIGTNGRMTGKVVGSRDHGGAGLGQDTGGSMPARFEAIEKFVAQGGKVRAKAGYQGSDSGLGQDVGGAAERRVSGLKKAHDAQRFVVDPNAVNPDQIPWWLQEKVSPLNQASSAQVNGAQTGLAKGFAAQRKNTAKTK